MGCGGCCLSVLCRSPGCLGFSLGCFCRRSGCGGCLSFLGWQLLSGLTFGLLHIFYVGPYMNNTFAGYYAERKAAALAEGVVTEAELSGETPIV